MTLEENSLDRKKTGNDDRTRYENLYASSISAYVQDEKCQRIYACIHFFQNHTI